MGQVTQDPDHWSQAPEAPGATEVRPAHLPPSVNLVCLLLTVVTTLIAGALMTLEDFDWRTARDIALDPSYWGLGIPYSMCLILILGAHEMGHYIACRFYGINASLPFLLPGPPFLGTFGAVIRIRAPLTDRRALFDVGVAGPIAGFVTALPVLFYGLSQSSMTRLPPRAGDIGLPSCLLLDLLYPLFFPGMGPGESVRLHPTFVAAWVGLLATGLNLLPLGQLDGGHMLYAISRRAHRAVSRFGALLLIALGAIFGGWHLLIFGIVFGIIGPDHPPPLDETGPPGPGRMVVALIGLAIFVLCIILRGPDIV